MRQLLDVVHLAEELPLSVDLPRANCIELRSLYLGAPALGDPGLPPGNVSVLVEGDDDFSAEGTLN